jgi:biopolymer transport protein ExbD/biopolymer transport protein TolR
MAFGRLQRAGASKKPMGDINMTPLIDVMLVLLVIFMITAPLMTASLKLDLPRTDAAQPGDGSPRFLAIALSPEGTLYLGDERISTEALDLRLQEAARQGADTEIQLRADRRVPYGQVAELIGRVQKAGLNRIAFVTESEGSASAPP